MRKEAVVAWVEVLFGHLPEESEEKTRKAIAKVVASQAEIRSGYKSEALPPK
jgi:hypothetical protein